MKPETVTNLVESAIRETAVIWKARCVVAALGGLVAGLFVALAIITLSSTVAP